MFRSPTMWKSKSLWNSLANPFGPGATGSAKGLVRAGARRGPKSSPASFLTPVADVMAS